MYRDRFVAVVIPAHNEERHVGAVIEDVPSFVDLVVVVDDGSTDRTAEVARSTRDPRLVVLTHRSNHGVGAAIVSGYRLALERGADVVALMGGDGQMDPADLPALLDPVVTGAADFAKGNRFSSRRSWHEMPRNRVFGNVVLSLLTKAATGYWNVFDAQNGYTAISRAALDRLSLARLETGYDFENRILMELSLIGARVRDVPIPARYGEETSGIRVVRDGLTIVRALFNGFWRRTATEYLRRGPSLPGVVLATSVLALVGAAVGLAALLAGVRAPLLGGAAGLALVIGSACLAVFFALDARRKRGHRSSLEADGLRIASLDLDSGSDERAQDQRELARRENT